MQSHDQQTLKLPVTKSSSVTEEKRIILGLEGFSIFYVFMVFALIAITTDSFPGAVAGAVFAYTFFKLYLKGKPPQYIELILLFPFRPKRFSHRTRDKVPILIDPQ